MERTMVKLNHRNTSIISVVGIDMSDGAPADNHSNTAEVEDHPKTASFTFGLRPIYYFSRVFGLLPFSIIHDSDGVALEPKIGKLDALWMVINIGIYASMTYFVYKDINYYQNAITTTLLTGDDLLFLMEIILGMVIIGLDFYNRFGFIDILRKFSIFDTEANSIISISFLFCLQMTFS